MIRSLGKITADLQKAERELFILEQKCINTGNEASLVLLKVEVVLPGESHHPGIIAEVPTDTSGVEGTLRHQDLGCRPLSLCLSFCNQSIGGRDKTKLGLL